MSDPARVYAALREQAIKLLRLDATNLSALEDMQINLTCTLMLEIDSLQSAQLSGKAIDISRIADAVKILRSLLPSAPLPSVDMAVETDAREKLEALINRQVHALEKRDERENVILKREVDELREMNAKLRNDLAAAAPVSADAEVEWVRDGTHCWFSVGYDPNGFGWVRVKPQDATPSPPQTSNQPPLPPPTASVPRSYLRDGNEPWRVFDGGKDRWSNNG
jgi:hypothetical protein